MAGEIEVCSLLGTIILYVGCIVSAILYPDYGLRWICRGIVIGLVGCELRYNYDEFDDMHP
jgi:hypothetical protein